MAVTTATYDATLARVRVSTTALGGTTATVTIDRTTDGVNYTTVRGAAALVPSGLAVAIDDYEFPDGVLVTYRARGWTAAGALTSTSTGTVTPSLAGAVWIKSAGRPFLNRTVTVVGVSDVARPNRGAALEVLGRRDPVGLLEVRGSREFDVTLRAASAVEAAALEDFLAFGDALYLHVPAGSTVLPAGGFFLVGDATVQRVGAVNSPVRYVTLPLKEVAAPDASIVGYTITWLGVRTAYATWTAVKAAKATWLALQETVSAPDDEVVG